MEILQLQTVSKETIKPFSPTPPQLSNHNLCFFDQQAPYLYLQFLYFYNNSEISNCNGHLLHYSDLLKKSLSKTLTRYYPFAGRLNDGISSVDCNDEGVNFLETKINCDLLQVIHNLKYSNCSRLLDLLFFDNLQGQDQRFNPLLSIQITQFECGGKAMGVFLSHKLADTATIVNFMNDWASIARSIDIINDHMSPVLPRFDATTFFQPADDQQSAGQASMILKGDQNIIANRFEIDASQIARLKSIVSEKLMEHPSRVEVVSALIYKALAISKSQPTTLLQTLNLRTRVVPSLPESLTGNIISFFVASSTTTDNKEIEMWRLVAEMKKNLTKFCEKYPRKYKTEEWSLLYKLHMKETMEALSNPADQTVYACSSWCRFPIYKADFGWGKPTWVTAPVILQKNVFLLIDTADGDGIEAWVSLDSKEMVLFQKNIEELLSFYHLKT